MSHPILLAQDQTDSTFGSLGFTLSEKKHADVIEIKALTAGNPALILGHSPTQFTGDPAVILGHSPTHPQPTRDPEFILGTALPRHYSRAGSSLRSNILCFYDGSLHRGLETSRMGTCAPRSLQIPTFLTAHHSSTKQATGELAVGCSFQLHTSEKNLGQERSLALGSLSASHLHYLPTASSTSP